MLRHICTLLLVLLMGLVGAAPLAFAQQQDVTATVSADVVELGDGFVVELTAEVDGDNMPTNPLLAVPPEMSSTRPRVSSSGFKMSWGTGRQTVMKKIYRVRWHLVPNELGTFTIAPPRVNLGGRTVVASGSLRVRVVEAGKAPRRRRRSLGMGGLGNFFGPKFPAELDDPFFDFDQPKELTSLGRRLLLRKEPARHLFLYIHSDKKKALVGQQVSLSYWMYYDRSFDDLHDQREPTLTDFLRLPLQETPGERVATRVAGRRYFAKMVSKVAIFPMRTGRLKTGTFAGKFEAPRVSRQLIPRESNDVEIEVVEPPMEGRPTGYRVGDVGRFKLSATVAPRETPVGEAVSVSVRVAGIGALPADLKLPARAGIEWLKPEKREDITVKRNRIGGWRSFGYVVSFKREGQVDLGTIELPYYDPDLKRYEVASAELGSVRVKPAKGRASDADAGVDDADKDDPFATLAEPRAQLSAYQPAGEKGLDPTSLWALVLTPPLGAVASGLAMRAAGVVRRRRQARKRDPVVLASAALDDMKRASDPKDVAAAAERALHLAIEAASGIKSRAVLREDLEERLRAASIEQPLVDDALALLDACSTVRFDPDPDDGADQRVRAQAKRVVKALARVRADRS